MAVVQSGDDYEKHFDPERYLSILYSADGKYKNVINFITHSMHQVFADGNISGKNLLDIGSGPTIHSVISASNYVDNIYLSDYAYKNLDVLKSWRNNDRTIQENMVQHVCDLENKGQSVKERVNQIRRKVKDIFHLNILSLEPVNGTDVPEVYDVITSSFCLDAAGQNKDEYLKCVDNVKRLLKPGGFFVNIGDLDNDIFMVDDVTLTGVKLNSTELKEIYVNAGFSIKFYREVQFDDKSERESFTSFVMVAQLIN